MQKSLLTLFCALCALSFIPSSVMATVLLNEHFNQATSTLATNESVYGEAIASSGWTNINGSGQIYMSSTNLSYSGYKSTADETGGAVEYKATFGKKAATPLSSNINSGSIYAAAIMNISAVGASNRDYNFALCTGTSSLATATNQFARINIRPGTSSGFRIAISKGAEANTLFLRWSDDLAFGTYLVVVEYQFINGDNNDVVKLYMNPVKGDKPKPTLTCVQDTIRESDSRNFGASQVADASGLQSAMLYSSSTNKAAMLIDELKVVTDWADLWEAGEEPGGGDDPEPITVPDPVASAITVNSATISWDAVTDADSYVLQRKINDGDYSEDIEIDKDERSYSMSGLESETKYYVRVKTIIDEDASDWAEINFTTAAEPATIMYNGITFNKYATTNAMPTSGTYYLAKNVTFGNIYTPTSETLTGDLTLYLHGRTLTPFNACIIVPNGVTLTIYEDADGQIYGGYSGTYLQEGMITVQEGGTLIVSEGKIENYADPSGSSYAIANYGTFKLSGAPDIIGESASIHLGSGNVITFESGNPLTNTTENKYSVNAAGQRFTSGWGECMGDATPSDHFSSAKSGFSQVRKGKNELYLVRAATVSLLENNDNTSVISDAVGGGTEDVLMDRAFTDAQYNTICLPFALSNDKLEAIFGIGYDLEEFVSSSMEGDVLSLNFASRTALEAGKPYLIKPAQPVIDILRNGVDISAEEPVDNTEDANISFHGVYSPTELTGGNKNLLFLGADNELFWPDATGNLKGFRAYFEVKGSAAQSAKRARIVKKEDSATGIDQITNDKSPMTNKIIKDNQLLILRDNKTYNVIGQMVK